MGSDVGNGLIFHDATTRDVLTLRLALAPCTECLEPSKNIGFARLHLDAPPDRFRIVAVIFRVGEPLHLVIQPFTAPGLHQFVEHLGENVGQMGDIADSIIDLAFIERSTRPIGKARTLIKVNAEPQVNKVRIADLLALPKRHCRNLRVK